MNDCENGRCMPGNVISGIKCDVTSCEYHREGDRCQAGCIEVGHCSGTCATSADTECVTYKPKQ